MAAKTYNLDGIGEVTIYKRSGTKRMNMRFVGGEIRISQPTWLPYAAGVKFAHTNATWIEEQRIKQPVLELVDNTPIGKSLTLIFEPGTTLRSRITESNIIIYIPVGTHYLDKSVQNIAKTAVKRALKKEAQLKLPDRLAYCADKYDFKYTSVHCKSMRTRWGSCNSKKEITLNIFLMMVPWELIDYVLVHELAHTQHMHHGPEFWQTVGNVIPDYKDRRKQLKVIQNSIAHLQ